MVRPMGVRRLIWTVASLLPTARTALCSALFLYLIVFPPNLNLIPRGPELPPFAREGGYDRRSDKSALKSISSTVPVLHVTTRPSDELRLDPFRDHWRKTTVGQCDVHIYSAFLDDRRKDVEACIKVSVAVPSTYKTRCANQARCLLEGEDGNRIVTKTSAVQFKEHFGLAYGSHYIICKIPQMQPGSYNWTKVTVIKQDPSMEDDVVNKRKAFPEPAIDINRIPLLDANQAAKKRRKMAACIKPFHYNWNRALWLIEFLEFHKVLGVSHFVFYNHTLGPAVDLVIQRYVNTGEATVLEWNLPLKTQKQIRTEGMFTALNECNLRLVNRFEFTLMVDVDEFILPYGNVTDLFQMIDGITGSPKMGAFVFKNAFHYLYWSNDTSTTEKYARGLFDQYDVKKINDTSSIVQPYLLTQTKTRRLVNLHNHGTRSKYIVRPDAADMIGNHNVWTFFPGFVAKNINEDVAVSHHYRICEFGGFDCLKLPSKTDRVAHRWAKSLFARVKKACDKTFGIERGCPKAPPLGSPW